VALPNGARIRTGKHRIGGWRARPPALIAPDRARMKRADKRPGRYHSSALFLFPDQVCQKIAVLARAQWPIPDNVPFRPA